MTFRVKGPGGDGIPGETRAFLDEWFSDAEHVTGYTSGSTGAPRRVDLLKSDMRASATLSNAYFRLTSRSTLLLCLSPGHIAGRMMIVRAILAGARLIAMTPGRDPLAALPSRTRVDLAAMVPLQVETTLSRANGAEELSRVRQLLVGGAALSPALERRLGALPVECHASYGMTETVSHVALRRVNGPCPSPIYTALGETRFEIDERGCLAIRAPHLRQGRFVTNDLVRLVDATRFAWLGRFDNVINSGGVKLFPEELETRIAPLLACRFFITALPDALLGERAVLVIEGTPWSASEQQLFTSRLSLVLSSRERPRSIIFLPSFMESASGKFLRRLPSPGNGE